ncbi:MAG: AI-2E family transporter [Planctomycetota bacterium]
MTDPKEERRERAVSEVRLISVGVIVIAAFLLGLGLYWLGELIQPLFVAFFAFFLLRPGAEFLSTKRVPPWSSYAVVVFVFVAMFCMIGLITINGVAKLQGDIGIYAESFNTWYAGSKKEGPVWEAVDNFARDQKWVDATGAVDWTGEVQKQLVMPAVRGATMLFGSLRDFLWMLLIVLFYLVFIILESVKFPERVRRAFPGHSAELLDIGASIGSGIRQYIQVKTAVSIGTALVSAIVLWWVEVENWALWSILIFFFNYIPYIGSILASIPPTIQAFFKIVEKEVQRDGETVIELVAEGHLWPGIIVGVVLTANQLIWGNLIEPKMTGTKLNISPVVLLAVVAFWGWMWGVVGMILSVPLAVALKIILTNFKRTRPLAILMSEQ